MTFTNDGQITMLRASVMEGMFTVLRAVMEAGSFKGQDSKVLMIIISGWRTSPDAVLKRKRHSDGLCESDRTLHTFEKSCQ